MRTCNTRGKSCNRRISHIYTNFLTVAIDTRSIDPTDCSVLFMPCLFSSPERGLQKEREITDVLPTIEARTPYLEQERVP